MVWSQKDAAGSWQVVEQGPSTNNLRVPITCTAPASCQAVDASAHDHQQAVIADDGTIAWFQDNSGGGLGYAIMRLDPGSSSPSVLEFSTRNHNCPMIYPPPFFIPIPNGPCTNKEHDAGTSFGISSDGKTISYFTFFDEGDANDRPFDINGQPLTDDSGRRLNSWATIPLISVPTPLPTRMIGKAWAISTSLRSPVRSRPRQSMGPVICRLMELLNPCPAPHRLRRRRRNSPCRDWTQARNRLFEGQRQRQSLAGEGPGELGRLGAVGRHRVNLRVAKVTRPHASK